MPGALRCFACPEAPCAGWVPLATHGDGPVWGQAARLLKILVLSAKGDNRRQIQPPELNLGKLVKWGMVTLHQGLYLPPLVTNHMARKTKAVTPGA